MSTEHSRPRVRAACTVCRKRKIKCDKTRPVCLICSRNNAAHLCEYLEPLWTKGLEPKDTSPRVKMEVSEHTPEPQSVELENLKYKLRKLEAFVEAQSMMREERHVVDPEETMSFYPDTVKFDSTNLTVSTMYGALFMKSVLQIDPCLKALRERFSTKTVKERISQSTDAVISDTNLEKKFRTRIVETILRDDLSSEPLSKDDKSSKTPLTVLFMTKHKLRIEMEIINRVSGLAPTKRAAWLLIDRYFCFVQPFFPCVDQERFCEQMNKLIGERSYAEVQIKFNIDRRMDLLTLALFFIVIRFGYLTFFDQGKPISTDSDDIRYIFANPVKENVIIAAQICMSPFQLLRLCTVQYIQIAIHMKMYQQLAPEEGDVADSQVLTGMIYQMAITIGMNRDPEGPGKFITDKQQNLWRKMWYTIISFDTFNGFLLDRMPPVVASYFDTKLPQFEGAKSANNMNVDIERETVESILAKQVLDYKYKTLTNMCLDLKSRPLVSGIIEAVEDFESYLRGRFDSFTDILTPTNHVHVDNIRKAKRIIQFTESITLVVSVTFHLFLHFERTQNTPMAFRYLLKCLELNYEVTLNCCSLLGKMKTFFDYGLEPLVTPNVQFALSSMVWLQHSIFLRCRHYSYFMSLQGQLNWTLKEKLDLMEERTTKTIRLMLKMFAKNSKRNYFAWRTLKIQEYIVERNKQLFEGHFNEHESESDYVVPPRQNIFFKFSLDQLDQLYKVCDVAKVDWYLDELNPPRPVNGVYNGAPMSAEDSVSGHEMSDRAWLGLMVQNQIDEFLGSTGLNATKTDLLNDQDIFFNAPLGDFSFSYM